MERQPTHPIEESLGIATINGMCKKQKVGAYRFFLLVRKRFTEVGIK